MSEPRAVVRYSVDPTVSRFVIAVTATGFLSAMGHNPTISVREYSAEAGFVPGSLEQAFVRFKAAPETFVVADDFSMKDKLEIESKMKGEVLAVAQYPEIVFESSKVSSVKIGENAYTVTIMGNLTLHGVTGRQVIVCQLAVNSETIRAFGEFTIRQTNYGIRPVSVAAGALRVKDDVKCSFDVIGRKQE